MLSGFLKRAVLVVLLALVVPAGFALNVTDGAPAPDFSLKSTTGKNLRLSEYRGDVVLLNFWASWCAKCLSQLPRIEDVYQEFGDDGLTVLSVNIDDDPVAARSSIARAGVSFPILLDEIHTVSKLYDLGSMPLTLLVDRLGNVRFVSTGFRPGNEESYPPQIRELLAE